MLKLTAAALGLSLLALPSFAFAQDMPPDGPPGGPPGGQPVMMPSQPGGVIVTLESPRPAVLQRIEGEGIAVVGRYVVSSVSFSPVCQSPCGMEIVPGGAQFFVAPSWDRTWGTRRISLDGIGPRAHLIHKPGSRWGVWGGYTLAGVGAAGLATGIVMIVLGASATPGPDADVLIGAGAGVTAGGAAFMAGGIALAVLMLPRLTVLDARGNVVGKNQYDGKTPSLGLGNKGGLALNW